MIMKMKQHFAVYGIPSKLLTDNGPQFANFSGPERYVTRYGRTVKPNPKFRDIDLWTANELPLCFAFTFNVIRFAEIACI